MSDGTTRDTAPWFIRWWPWVPARWYFEKQAEVDALEARVQKLRDATPAYDITADHTSTRAPVGRRRSSGMTDNARAEDDATARRHNQTREGRS